MTFFLLFIVVPLLVNLFSSELEIWVPRWLRRLFQRALRNVSEPRRREDLLREWTAELEARPGLAWKLWFGVPMAVWGCRAVVRQIDGSPTGAPRGVAVAVAYYRWCLRHPISSGLLGPACIYVSGTEWRLVGLLLYTVVGVADVVARHFAKPHLSIEQALADFNSWESRVFSTVMGPVGRGVETAAKWVRVRFSRGDMG